MINGFCILGEQILGNRVIHSDGRQCFSLLFHCQGVSSEQSTYPSILFSRQPHTSWGHAARQNTLVRKVSGRNLFVVEKQGEMYACCRNTKQDLGLVKMCTDYTANPNFGWGQMLNILQCNQQVKSTEMFFFCFGFVNLSSWFGVLQSSYIWTKVVSAFTFDTLWATSRPTESPWTKVRAEMNARVTWALSFLGTSPKGLSWSVYLLIHSR